MKKVNFFLVTFFSLAFSFSGLAYAKGKDSLSPEMVGVKGRNFTVGVT